MRAKARTNEVFSAGSHNFLAAAPPIVRASMRRSQSAAVSGAVSHEEQQAQAADLALSETGEHYFWETEPRYSVTGLQSLAPASGGPDPSRWRFWAARLLFATICCAVVALLGLEIRSMVQRVPLLPAVVELKARALAMFGKQSTARP